MELKQLIIIPVYNQGTQIKQNLPFLEDINCDILMIDDGSTDNTYGIIRDLTWMKYIKHEQNLGIGASIITGCEYARDLGYDIAIILNLNDNKFKAEIKELMENINYGYDIVNSSRILENYDYHDIPQEYIALTSEISSQIRDITGFDITDPLSGILAIRIEVLQNMELTEFSHSLLLQLWIQANYFGLSIIEIPAQSGIEFGKELSLYDDPINQFISLMEAEKILYPKNNLN